MAFSAEYIYRIIDRYTGPLNHISRSTTKYVEAANRAARASKVMGARMRSTGEAMSGFGGTVGSLMTVIGGTQAMGAFLDFEGVMNSARATTKATGGEFLMLSKIAKHLGATTEFSAGQAASAIDMLGRNGLTATQIMDGAVHATIGLASAAGTDLANAANIATDVMANFNKSAKDLGPIMDKITGVTINSKFNIDDYRLALAQAGGVAGAVGVSLDDFNTSIAAMSPLFSSGSDAGTSFKMLLQRLNPASKEAAVLMRKLGLNFFESNGQMKSMAEVSALLNKAFSGLTEEQKNHAASTIFGTDAMRAALGLAKAGPGEFNRLAGSIGEVNAKQVQAMRMAGLTGVVKNLKSAVEGLVIAFFVEGGLGNILAAIFRKITSLVRAVSSANPMLLKFASVALLVVAGVSAIVAPLGIMTTMFGTVATFIGGLGISITALAAPVAVVVAGFVAFIIMVKGMWNNSAVLRQSLLNLADAFSPLVSGVVTLAKMFGQVLGASLEKSSIRLGGWGDTISIMINGVAALFKSLFTIIEKVSGALGALSTGNLSTALDVLGAGGIAEKAKGLWGKAKGFFGGGPDTVPNDMIAPRGAVAPRRGNENNRVEISGQIGVSARGDARVESANINLNRGTNLVMAGA